MRFLGKQVAIIDYAPSGTGFLAKNVQKKVASGDNAFIIANHGIVALGTDPDRAVFNMALLEKVSIAYLLALTTEAGKVYTIPAADPRDRLQQAAQGREADRRADHQVRRAGAGARRRGAAQRRRGRQRGGIAADVARARDQPEAPGAERPGSATPSASTSTSPTRCAG